MRGGRGRRPGTRTTLDGVSYRSVFESTLASDLASRGISFTYEKERIEYTVEHVYIPDFYLEDMHFVVEAKGYFPPEDRRKLIAIKRTNPFLDIRIVFQRDSKLGTGPNPLTCLKWAKKHGFRAAIGFVPKAWLEED